MKGLDRVEHISAASHHNAVDHDISRKRRELTSHSTQPDCTATTLSNNTGELDWNDGF